jgi:signal transduction histidine kinase
MRYSGLFRTTTFRLTMLYGLIFALATLALLWMVYLRSAVYLTGRVDEILDTEAQALMRSPRPGLRQRVIEDLTLNGDRTNAFGLFAANGARLAGNLDTLPAVVRTSEHPVELPPTVQFPSGVRLIARRLSTGEILVVGRDVRQLREMRDIITSALLWSGVSILLVGLACGTAFSIAPLRRLRRLQAVASNIATSQRGDELDMFADTINHMMDEVESLMSEVTATTAVIAHDLLNPLASAALKLRRLQQVQGVQREDIAPIGRRMEEVLDRFRAILRLAELESRHRRAGFTRVDLADVIAPAEDLYGPLAEEAGVRLSVSAQRGMTVEADPQLLFEALSNLIDNAIKYAGRGSTVQVRTAGDAAHPRIIVQDDGPGIPGNERTAVVQRFYRAERQRDTAGTGLGLSVVAAIVRLHDFNLLLEDADPGVRAVIEAGPATAHLPG